MKAQRGPTQAQRLEAAEREVAALRRLVGELAAREQASVIPSEMLSRLIRLCHPDKHGNSRAANEATAWLLDQRRAAA